jgi:hypothetical protein
MPNTYIDYTAPVANYSFTFPYLDVSHVKVFVDDVAKVQGTHYTVATTPTRVVFTAGNSPANGATVRIRRVTFKDSALVDFVNGSTLLESDLDTAVRQTLFINQETTELNDTTLQIGAGTPDFYAQDKKITHLETPTQANEAANKSYVDNTTVSIAGDTMTGPLAMSNNKITGLGTPTASGDASTKAYVDTNDVLKLNKAGDTMSGTLAMAGNRITGLANPVSLQDAATQASVNEAVSNAVLFGSTTAPDLILLAGTGSQTVFTVEPITPTSIYSANSYLVSIDGVIQTPEVDFIISGVIANVMITFTTPPPAGSVISVRTLGYKVPVGDEQIAPLSITAGKLASDSVTNAKILNGEVTSAKLASTIDFTGKTVSGLTKANVGLTNVTNTDTTNATNISSGTLSADRLATSGAVAATYGALSASTFSMPQIVVDNKGRVTSATTVPWVGRRLVNIVRQIPDCTTGKVPGLFTAAPWLNLIPTTSTDIFAGTGANFSYTPLVAGSLIRMKYIFQFSPYNPHGLGHFRFRINGSEVTYFTLGSSTFYEGLINYEWYYTPPTTAAFTYQLVARAYSGNNHPRVHYTYHWDGAGGQVYVQPQIIVEEYA